MKKFLAAPLLLAVLGLAACNGDTSTVVLVSPTSTTVAQATPTSGPTTTPQTTASPTTAGPTTTITCTNTWEVVATDHGNHRWFANGVPEIGSAKTPEEARTAIGVWLDKVQQDPELLAGAASYFLDRDVDPATLHDGPCASAAAVKLVREIAIAIAVGQVQPSQAPTDGINSGVDANGIVVAARQAGITGNLKAVQVTLQNGQKVWVLERCGNAVVKKRPRIPKGPTDQTPPPPTTRKPHPPKTTRPAPQPTISIPPATTRPRRQRPTTTAAPRPTTTVPQGTTTPTTAPPTTQPPTTVATTTTRPVTTVATTTTTIPVSTVVTTTTRPVTTVATTTTVAQTTTTECPIPPEQRIPGTCEKARGSNGNGVGTQNGGRINQPVNSQPPAGVNNGPTPGASTPPSSQPVYTAPPTSTQTSTATTAAPPATAGGYQTQPGSTAPSGQTVNGSTVSTAPPAPTTTVHTTQPPTTQAAPIEQPNW